MVQGSPLTWRGHGHPTHHRGLLTWRGVAVPTPHSSRGFVEFLLGPGGGVAQGNCRCPHVLSGEMNTREDGPGLCASGRRPLGLVVFESDRCSQSPSGEGTDGGTCHVIEHLRADSGIQSRCFLQVVHSVELSGEMAAEPGSELGAGFQGCGAGPSPEPGTALGAGGQPRGLLGVLILFPGGLKAARGG